MKLRQKSHVLTGSAKKTLDTREQFTDVEFQAFLKRIMESPGEDGLQVLKGICLDSNAACLRSLRINQSLDQGLSRTVY